MHVYRRNPAKRDCEVPMVSKKSGGEAQVVEYSPRRLHVLSSNPSPARERQREREREREGGREGREREEERRGEERREIRI
jgi:hypothetical protein